MSNDAPSGPKHKTLSFVRAVLQIPQGQPVGNIYRDVLCALAPSPITTNFSGDMPAADFRGAFAEQQAAAGYTANDESLFGDMDTKDPDLLVAAAITGLNIKVCAGMAARGGLLQGMSSSATAQIVVNWQVANGLERKIVFKTTTQAKASVQADYRSADMVAMRAAFSQAAKALFAMPEFQQVTTFTADEQATTAQLSEPAPPTTYIASVPLSAQSFQEQLKSTQAQVVTIRTGMASGSGFYIADGLIMTNHHVAGKGTAVKVRFLSGKEIDGLSIASNAKR
ncbi:MAG: serine protease, partial [Rhodospirillaceae bacterium]